MAAVVQLLGATPAVGRPRLFADIARAFPQLDIGSLPPDPTPAADAPDGPNLRGLQRRLGGNFRIFALPHEESAHKVGIALPDGAMIFTNLATDEWQRPFWIRAWIATLLFAAISVTLLGLWTAHALTAPLSSFARAAEKLQPQRCPRATTRTRPRGDSIGCKGAQPHAGADHQPDRRPHQDAGRHQSRLEDSNYLNAATFRIYRRRCASQLYAGPIPIRCDRCWSRAFLPAQRP